MKIVVSCTDPQKEELTAAGTLSGAEIVYINQSTDLAAHPADTYLDLQFENSQESLRLLESLLPRTIIINSVIETLSEIHPSFVRINAWPTFLTASLIEASCLDTEKKKPAETALSFFNKKIEWLPDEPGLITPRVISMIINEAYFALSEGVSTKEEIDTAMKLGTNYPYGPFEWSLKIGLHHISSLLTNLSKQQSRYTPCPLLLKELTS